GGCAHAPRMRPGTGPALDPVHGGARARRRVDGGGKVRGGGIVTLVCSLVRLNEDSDVGSDTRHDVLLIYDDKGELPPLPCEVHRLSYRPGEFWGATRKARRILRGYDAVPVHAAHPAVVLAVALERQPCFLLQHGMTVSSGSPTAPRLRQVG